MAEAGGMKKSQMIDELRSWFEAGIAYNLIMSAPLSKKITASEAPIKAREELLEFELVLTKSIAILEPIRQVAVIAHLLQAFRLGRNFDINWIKLNELLPPGEQLTGRLYCIWLNWPHWSWNLLSSATQKCLAPERLIDVYYELRKQLEMADEDDELSLDTSHPTLQVLSALCQQRRLTADLIGYSYRHDSAGMAEVEMIGLERYYDANRSAVEEGRKAKIQSHFMSMAADLARGTDPLERVPGSLLTGRHYSQWSAILHALYCLYHNKTAHEFSLEQFANDNEAIVPKLYRDQELKEPKKIEHYLSHLCKRADHLWFFFRPETSPFSMGTPCLPKNVLHLLGEKKALQVMLSHWLMFYLSLLKHEEWLGDMQRALRKGHGKRLLTDLLMGLRTPEPGLFELEAEMQRLSQDRPGKLPMFWFSEGLITEPLTLLKRANGVLNPKGERERRWDSEEWQALLQICDPEISLIIPQNLMQMQIDLSLWLKPGVIVQMPMNRNGSPLRVFHPNRLDAGTLLTLGAEVVSKGTLYGTLNEVQALPVKQLMKLLMGVAYYWHVAEYRHITIDGFLDILTLHSIPDVSNKTILKRIEMTKEWLSDWPNVGRFVVSKTRTQ